MQPTSEGQIIGQDPSAAAGNTILAEEEIAKLEKATTQTLDRQPNDLEYAVNQIQAVQAIVRERKYSIEPGESGATEIMFTDSTGEKNNVIMFLPREYRKEDGPVAIFEEAFRFLKSGNEKDALKIIDGAADVVRETVQKARIISEVPSFGEEKLVSAEDAEVIEAEKAEAAATLEAELEDPRFDELKILLQRKARHLEDKKAAQKAGDGNGSMAYGQYAGQVAREIDSKFPDLRDEYSKKRIQLSKLR